MPDAPDSPQVDMNEIFMDVVGGVSDKKRVFGLGCRSRSYYTAGGSSARFGATSQCDLDEVLNQKIQEIEKRMKEENVHYKAQLKEEIIAEMKEENARFKEEMKTQIKEEMKTLMNEELEARMQEMSLKFMSGSNYT